LLINYTVLTVNSKHKFRVLECEFYLNDQEIHHDTFVTEIIEAEKKRTNSAKFPDGVWSYVPNMGLFITFGQVIGGKDVQGRIFIRSIVTLRDSTQTQLSYVGSREVLNAICNKLPKSFITQTQWGQCFDASNLVNLSNFSDQTLNKSVQNLEVARSMGKESKVYSCPRAGY
jgi:hypothetical protein